MSENMLETMSRSEISLDDADLIRIDRKKQEIEIIREDGEMRYVKKYKKYHNTFDLKEEVTKTLSVKAEYWQDITALYRDGYTQTQIAKRLGISQSYVSRILRKNPPGGGD